MSSIIDTIRTAEGALTLKGADKSAIEAAEKALGLKFSEEYKAYTTAFGAACVNDKELTGVVSDPNLNVVDATLSARSITPQALPEWYVVHDLHIDGVMVWQDGKGNVFQTVPFKEPKLLCRSLAEYIVLE